MCFKASKLPVIGFVTDKTPNTDRFYKVYKSVSGHYYVQQFVKSIVRSKPVRINKVDLLSIYGIKV